MGKKGITIAGTLIADVGYEIDFYPKRGYLTKIHHPNLHTGGTNNLIVDLARLDPELEIKVSGLVGEDEKGQFILDTLGEYPNVKTVNVTRRGRTSVTYAMTEKDSKQRTFFFDPGTMEEYNEADIAFDQLEAEIFHLEYLLLLGTLDEKDEIYGTRAAKVLHEARKRGMRTSIDVVSEDSGRYQDVVVPALKYVDYCVVNEAEAEGITGLSICGEHGIDEENVWQVLEKIKEYGVCEWVVVHSPSCSYGLNCPTGEKVKVESMHLPKGFIKGTTGAGDAYCAGVLFGAYHGFMLEDAMKAGTACASCSLSHENSNSGVAPYREAMELYEKYKVK